MKDWEKIIPEHDREIYEKAGYAGKQGFGQKPALLVIDVITVSIGSLSASLVHPREVLKPAIQASAAALVVAHNHPTGVATPSQEDVVFTQRLGRCADLMGIRLLDHLIIGDGRFESMKARGHL